MLPSTARRHILVFAAYVALGAAFAWPLPLSMAASLPGSPSGDTGVYVWNIWVFRHELIEHQRFPFYTSEILSLASPTPLTLHNYTTFANVLAFFLLPLAGVVRTFNGLLILSAALSAYALYLLARKRSGDETAAWLAGAAFGFSPFLMARMTAHFSLLQAAPLPIFALLLARLYEGASRRTAALAGGVVAWAYLCDPYYAVYCMLMLAFMLLYATVTVAVPAERPKWASGTWAVDLAIVCLVGLIAGIMIRGGGRVEVAGLRLSMHSLYTPTLLLTGLVGFRVAVAARPRFGVRLPSFAYDWRPYLLAGFTGAAVLSPMLFPLMEAVSTGGSLSAPVLWRSSARGLDLAAFIVPNPLHPWLAWVGSGWLASRPEGFVENVASIPWSMMLITAVGLIAYKAAAPKGWLAWTGTFLLLSLGPFIHVAGINTYVPTPWTLLRYVPGIGVARMPTRFGVLVAMGAAMIFCLVLADMRRRSRRPALLGVIAGALLIFELLPAPRQLHSAELPRVFKTIAADPRPLRVLNLPLGIRDGLSSDGNYTALSQFHQTLHQKPLIGGYVSRLPRAQLGIYGESVTLRTLLALSEGQAVPAEQLALARERAPAAIRRFAIGWVVLDRARTSAPLEAFAREWLDLRLVESAEGYDLYSPALTGAGTRP